MRRRLSVQDVEAIAQGSAILGTGGGGDPYLGTVFVAHAVEEFGEPELISVDELDDAALVVQSVMVGSPVPFMEKLSLGPELPRAFAGMQAAVQRPITALMTPEIGGVNTVIAIALAAELGLPVVDADGMGRAFQHSPHATSIPALEHYGVQVEGDSDEQHNVAVHAVIMAKVRDRQHDRNDTGQPVYGF